MSRIPGALAREEFCYLTTVGRATGRPHEIEIWFALRDDVLYMLAGNPDSDWVKNLRREPGVTVRISDQSFKGIARLVDNPEEDGLARRLLVEKYERSPGRLSNWRRTALPVAVDPA